MTNTRRSAAALALIAGLALSQAAAGSAAAEDQPVSLAFTTTSATVEYGQYWSFPLTSDYACLAALYEPGLLSVTTTGAGSYEPAFTMYGVGSGGGGYVQARYDAAPLSAGAYSFTVSGETGGDYNTTAETPTPASLTIEKAKLGVELRVLADPSNGDAAIVTAKFTGRFVDEYSSSFFPGSAQSPAGTWNITLKGADGEVATERSVERAAGDDVLATSFYWADAEPGEQYTASASFTPSGASANNFTIGAAQNFAYTAPESARPVPTSSATAKPDASLPEATGFGLPLWALILVIVLIVALGALVTILSIRLSRRPSTSTGEVQS